LKQSESVSGSRRVGFICSPKKTVGRAEKGGQSHDRRKTLVPAQVNAQGFERVGGIKRRLDESSQGDHKGGFPRAVLDWRPESFSPV